MAIVQKNKSIQSPEIAAKSSVAKKTPSELPSKSQRSKTTEKSAENRPSKSAASQKSAVSTTEHLEGREKWTNHLDFIMSGLGFAVGLGNVWRYPYLAYENGGAAFIIPYLISVFFAGLPLYGIESFLGQLSGLGASQAHSCLAPIFHGVGWSMCGVSYLVSLYYNMVIAWSLIYLVECFRFSTELPWTTCDNRFNTLDCRSRIDDRTHCNYTTINNMIWVNKSCHNETKVAENSMKIRVSSADEYFYIAMLGHSESDEELGSLSMHLTLALFFAWVLVFVCIAGGVKASGKIVYFTALYPYVMIVFLLIYSCFLEGAGNGVKEYLVPKFEHMAQFKVWKDAAVQVFFSLNPAIGGIISMASYNQFHNNLAKDSITICILDSLTSMLAGIAVFAATGHLAHLLNTTVAEATKSQVGLVFIVFPEVLSLLNVGSRVMSIAFFIMLISLGLDSQFILFETPISAICDVCPNLRERKRRITLVLVGCVVSFLIGLLFCTEGGIYIFFLFDDHTAGYCTIIIAFMESVLIGYIYGVDNFIRDISLAIGYKLNWYWKIVWLFTLPIFMLGLFACTLYFYYPVTFRDKPLTSKSQSFGWMLSMFPVGTIVFVAIYHVVKIKIEKRPWIDLVTPTDKWNPKLRHDLALIEERQKEKENSVMRLNLSKFNV